MPRICSGKSFKLTTAMDFFGVHLTDYQVQHLFSLFRHSNLVWLFFIACMSQSVLDMHYHHFWPSLVLQYCLYLAETSLQLNHFHVDIDRHNASIFRRAQLAGDTTSFLKIPAGYVLQSMEGCMLWSNETIPLHAPFSIKAVFKSQHDAQA